MPHSTQQAQHSAAGPACMGFCPLGPMFSAPPSVAAPVASAGGAPLAAASSSLRARGASSWTLAEPMTTVVPSEVRHRHPQPSLFICPCLCGCWATTPAWHSLISDLKYHHARRRRPRRRRAAQGSLQRWQRWRRRQQSHTQVPVCCSRTLVVLIVLLVALML